MNTDDMKKQWDEVVAKLKQERDELAVKMHLGKKEAAAEWEKLEAKWHEIKATKLPPMAEAAKDTAAGLADELKKGYERMRKLL